MVPLSRRFAGEPFTPVGSLSQPFPFRWLSSPTFGLSLGKFTARVYTAAVAVGLVYNYHVNLNHFLAFTPFGEKWRHRGYTGVWVSNQGAPLACIQATRGRVSHGLRAARREIGWRAGGPETRTQFHNDKEGLSFDIMHRPLLMK